MEYDLKDSTGFSGIGKVWYEGENGSGYLYATSETSEYLDFGKTGFFFTGEMEELISNLFNYEDTLRLAGGHDGFQELISASFPTLSPDESSQEAHFFGRIESPSGETAYLCHLSRGVKRVKVYDPEEKLVLTVKFGKEDDTKLQKEEVESEKILYLVNTIDGELKEVNFYSLAYPRSKNPHPHMQEVVLRNDALWSENTQLLKDGIIDSRSGTLLGIKELREEECSWFRGARSGYSRSSSATEITINGRTWKRATRSEVFGENPEISPYWFCQEDLGESEFKHFYVTIKEGMGDVKPGGLVYSSPGKPLKLTVTPEKGFRYDEIENVFGEDIIEDGEKVEINGDNYPIGYNFEVVFKEIEYLVNLRMECVKDFPKGHGTVYNLFEVGSLEGYNYSSLSEANIKFIYQTEDGKEQEFTRANPPKVTSGKDLYFRLDARNSNYELLGDLTYPDGSDILKSGEWYVLQVSKFPEAILGGGGESIILLGELSSRKYEVTIKTTHGIQISTPKKNIMEYHNIDPNNISGGPRPFITRLILNNPENKIEVWKDGVLVDDGDKSFSLTPTDGVWTFRVPLIENNYEIIVK